MKAPAFLASFASFGAFNAALILSFAAHSGGISRGAEAVGWISHMLRRGKKVEDELPVPVQSGFVRVEDIRPVFEHQKVKE